jgi:hypothetical protein
LASVEVRENQLRPVQDAHRTRFSRN